MRVLLLRFDAPLVSFGAPMVDQNGVVQAFPAVSMLTGLFGNALGWHHRDAVRLGGLQERIRYAARIDRRGEALVDYQTVDLGQPWMIPEAAGWTTRGRIAARGGASNEGTHIRQRHYRADSVCSVAVALQGDEEPTVDDVSAALQHPERPLFIGRKCCLPAVPLLLGIVDETSPLTALAAVPRHERGDPGPLPAWWWPGDHADGVGSEARVVPVTDERDWANQVHVGRRFMHEGLLSPREASYD